MNISIDADKALDKIQYLFINNNKAQQIKNRGKRYKFDEKL